MWLRRRRHAILGLDNQESNGITPASQANFEPTPLTDLFPELTISFEMTPNMSLDTECAPDEYPMGPDKSRNLEMVPDEYPSFEMVPDEYTSFEMVPDEYTNFEMVPEEYPNAEMVPNACKEYSMSPQAEGNISISDPEEVPCISPTTVRVPEGAGYINCHRTFRTTY
jgi:hypothetical protein